MAENATVKISVPPPHDDTMPARVLRKATWRLIPLLALLYILNLLDRGNLGFARITMQPDLGLSDRVFDFGFGIFYFGYLLFEVPANLLLQRVGARRWMARIMISWGVVSAATMFVTGPASFYAVRILLGVAEAGFFPGIVLYLTYWFPARDRVRVMAFFMAANAVAGIAGNPLSGAIMQYLNGTAGLTGWQWMFLLEGIPSVLVGFVVLFYLPDGPAQARWLRPDERDWLVERMSREEDYRRQRHGSDLVGALIDRRVWLLIGLYFTVAVASNAAAAYNAKNIRQQFGWGAGLPFVGASTVGLMASPMSQGPLLAGSALMAGSASGGELKIGLLVALPHVCAVLGMTLLGAHSDRTGERPRHVAFAAFMAAVGWALAAYAPSPWLFLAGLCLAQTGMMSMLPPFWALPTAFLSGAAAAGGIALINSVANLGGLLGPNILGEFGLWSLAAILFAGSLLALCVRHDATLDKQRLDQKTAPR